MGGARVGGNQKTKHRRRQVVDYFLVPVPRSYLNPVKMCWHGNSIVHRRHQSHSRQQQDVVLFNCGVLQQSRI